MKTSSYFFAFALFFSLQAKCQSYYVSSSASSNGNGSQQTPWNSFASLNALLATATLIDTIYLKRGDVFRDRINITLADNFVITAYGSGSSPVISGADQVTNWTQVGGQSYWQASISQNPTSFFVNDKEQILARYPDENTYLATDAYQ